MIIKLKPKFSDKIWGGSYFKDNLNYSTSSNCGEAWGISGIKGNSSVIENTIYKDLTLDQLYQEQKHLFGNYSSKEFPILIKLIDANRNLSIQIHPGDEYAKKYNDSYGKTECWYILDTLPNNSIIIGHNANSYNEIISYIEANEYDSFLNNIKIEKGDLFYIPAGTIHAICEGTVILEVQQSSDLTFRFYDYNRLENGKPRELHQKEALDVITVPSPPIKNTGNTNYFDFDIITRPSGNYTAHEYGDYYYIIEGSGKIGDVKVQTGDFIFVTSHDEYKISNDLKVGYITIK